MDIASCEVFIAIRSEVDIIEKVEEKWRVGDCMELKGMREGMVFKSYRELCEHLGEGIRSGNSRIKQINEWSKYFLFKRVRQSFRIKEIYEKPLAMSYSEKLEVVLLGLMARSRSTNHMIFSPKTILLMNLNMVNGNYKDYKYGAINGEVLSRSTGIELDVVYDFFDSVNEYVTYQLERMLNNLSSRRLISYNKVDMVCSKDMSHRKATQEEVEYSLVIQKGILEEMKCNSVGEVISRRLYSLFVSKCEDAFERVSEHKFFYKAYEIVFYKPNIEITVEELAAKYTMNNEDYRALVVETNSMGVDNINKNAESRVRKAVDRNKQLGLDRWLNDFKFEKDILCTKGMLNISRHTLDSILIRSDPDYLDNVKKLNDIVVKYGANGIV